MLLCILRVLLGLGRVLFTFGMIILAVGVRSGTMRLCSGLMMFRRLVVCVFHVDFSCWPENFGDRQLRPE